ncbi:MAG: prepilin-type N-terminal cleavage/methylation domain-containing protein [Patescibacteria group bacterium]|nr:prepilin-type N-terminal cleavage/methylation domain-containing protein [Patescibacteria group bacterium]
MFRFPPIKSSSGFTLAETLAAMFIFLILLQGSLTLYNDTIKTNDALTGNLNAQMEVRAAFTSMLANIRSASPSAAGAYTIDTASSTYFSFYSDVDRDGLKEKIRYFLSGKILRIGVIEPTGNPPIYNPANEKTSALINDVVNPAATPIFSYYDSSYDGTTAPLTLPINISAVRLIKINVLIDHDPSQPPAAMGFSTQVSIRNLKDNL